MYLLVWIWAACAPWAARIEAAPVGARDGDVWTHAGPIHLAFVGHAARAPDRLFRALADRPAQLVVLTGDTVARSRPMQWRQLHQRVRRLKILPVAGEGERTADPDGRGMMLAWEGLGVAALTEPGPWYAVDLHTGGARWRVVVLDTSRETLGSRWNDQRFWIPKVVGDDGYDYASVVLHGGPGRMDGGLDRGTVSSEELLSLVRSHADATRLVMVVSGGAEAPAVVLPGGRWGEAWVTTGSPTDATQPLQRFTQQLSLAQGYASALEDEIARRTGIDREVLQTRARFDPAEAPVAGFWDLTLDGARATLTLQLASPTGWSDVRALTWSPTTGWSAD